MEIGLKSYVRQQLLDSLDQISDRDIITCNPKMHQLTYNSYINCCHVTS